MKNKNLYIFKLFFLIIISTSNISAQSMGIAYYSIVAENLEKPDRQDYLPYKLYFTNNEALFIDEESYNNALIKMQKKSKKKKKKRVKNQENSQNELSVDLEDEEIVKYTPLDSIIYRYLPDKKNFIVYKEKRPYSWSIGEEMKVIKGYPCMKAYRENRSGDEVIAWFTFEVPVPFGPGKGAMGLPGLVIRYETPLSDNNKQIFELKSIDFNFVDLERFNIYEAKEVDLREFSLLPIKKESPAMYRMMKMTNSNIDLEEQLNKEY